jgi:hypothetical protein
MQYRHLYKKHSSTYLGCGFAVLVAKQARQMSSMLNMINELKQKIDDSKRESME